jgi:alkanesulfonate monooxygenase
MPVEFISSTNFGPSTGVKYSGFDPDYARRYVRMLDDGGFDWTLVGYDSQRVDSVTRAQFILNNSERIKPIVAHRPGFQFPTQFAKALAGLDRIGSGRLATHIIAGGSDEEMRREGDYTTKEQRYRRAEEFIEIIRRIWAQDGPISHAGEFYTFEDFQTDIKPVQEAFAISVGGSSQQAYEVGGRQGDIFGLWGEPLKETAEQIAEVRAAAEAAGRTEPPRISVSFRPILGPTEELAWDRAHQILDTTRENVAAFRGAWRRPTGGAGGAGPQNAGSQRLLAAAEKGELHDRALWTPLAAATGAAGNSTALVGTPETVAAAILDYIDIGVTTILIRGYDPYDDAIDYGRQLLPIVREEVARRDEKEAVA